MNDSTMGESRSVKAAGPARRTEAWRIEVCPVCGNGPNVTGAKYCYGRPAVRHDKARWEWIDVVPAESRVGLADVYAVIDRERETPDLKPDIYYGLDRARRKLRAEFGEARP